ncbi:hypothetical protein Tco_1291208 [Tanacetum coccineum]
MDVRDLRRKLRSRRSRSISGSPERNPIVFSRIRRDRSESLRHRPEGRRDGGVFNRLGGKEKSVSAHSEIRYYSYHSRRTNPTPKKCYHKGTSSQDTEAFSESEDSNWWTLEVKCIKDLVEIHHIKQREEESTKDFVQRFKVESRHVNGALECMRISGFMHGITNPELIKCLHDNIPKPVDEMMQRSERRRDKFTLLTKSPKEILALDKGKFKAPPPMTTPVEKRNNNKFYEFHEEAKAAKNGETFGKDKPLAILMVQPWQRVARQKIIQSFSPNLEISFPPLGDEDGGRKAL